MEIIYLNNSVAKKHEHSPKLPLNGHLNYTGLSSATRRRRQDFAGLEILKRDCKLSSKKMGNKRAVKESESGKLRLLKDKKLSKISV